MTSIDLSGPFSAGPSDSELRIEALRQATTMWRWFDENNYPRKEDETVNDVAWVFYRFLSGESDQKLAVRRALAAVKSVPWLAETDAGLSALGLTEEQIKNLKKSGDDGDAAGSVAV